MFVIILQNFAHLFMVMIYLYFTPYKDPHIQFREVFNEISIIIVNYWYFSLTDSVLDPITKVWIGQQLIRMTFVNMTINILQALYIAGVVPLFKKAKLKYMTKIYEEKLQKH